jgi:hypothetical protein
MTCSRSLRSSFSAEAASSASRPNSKDSLQQGALSSFLQSLSSNKLFELQLMFRFDKKKQISFLLKNVI